MPGVSKNQIVAMRIAAHDPDKLYSRNKGMLSMRDDQIDEFAKTPTKGLPTKLSHFSGRKNHESKFSEMRRK